MWPLSVILDDDTQVCVGVSIVFQGKVEVVIEGVRRLTFVMRSASIQVIR